MDILEELDYTQEFLQSCNFNVDVLAYEFAEYKHVELLYYDDYDVFTNLLVFMNKIWTFGMYTFNKEENNYSMFYNGFLIRQYEGEYMDVRKDGIIYYYHNTDGYFMSNDSKGKKKTFEKHTAKRICDGAYNVLNNSNEYVYVRKGYARNVEIINICNGVLPGKPLEMHSFDYSMLDELIPT